MDYGTETIINDEFLIFMIAIIIGFFLVIGLIVYFFIPFKEERDYIKMEMKRCYEEDEYLYWRSQLKLLYLQSIPLIGRFFR